MTIPGGLLTRAPKIIYRPKAVAEALNLPEPEGPAWIADLASVATFLDSLQPSDESIRRWTILLVAFACRPEAALEAGPSQFNATERTIRLNPLGRRPNKKFRPTIPVADSLLPLLAEWSTSEQYTGFSAKN
jgi:integrase